MDEKTEKQSDNKLGPWLQLLRLPNLLTVPGDPVAGYLLAAGALGGEMPGVLFPAVGAALCLYCFGLILNDLMDLQVDVEERPERPLPSGLISVKSARGAAIGFAFTGLNLALYAGVQVLFAAAVLSLLIIVYNAGLKKLPVFGVVSMGLCRGFSFLLGVSAAVPSLQVLKGASGVPAMLGFAAVTLTFIGISAVAKREMDEQKPMGVQRMLPFASLLITLPGLVIALSALERIVQPAATVYIFLMIMTLMRAWLLGGIMYRAQPVPVTVGGHIRNHLMVQACLCSAVGGWGLVPALGLLFASQIFANLSRRFYSS